jgi:hypothetical protein
MKFSSDKRIALLVRNLIRQGWAYQNKGRHGKIISPNGKKFPVPSTPSDHRAFENFKHDIKKIYKTREYI